MLHKTLLFVIITVFSFSCKTEGNPNPDEENRYETIAKLRWLIGQWEHSTETEQSYEIWHMANDSTLRAHSFTLVKADTIFAERVTLEQKGKDIFFTAIAYNQNEDQPVTFKLVSSKNGEYTFENPHHDFPTRITYSNPANDSLHAWIEGTLDGLVKKVDFYFKKKAATRNQAL